MTSALHGSPGMGWVIDCLSVTLCTCDQQFLRIVWRAQTICPVHEIALGKIGRRDVPCFSKARFAGHCLNLRRREEAEERRPACSRSLLCHLEPGTYLGVCHLQREQECHGERRSRGEGRDLTQRGRVLLLG